MRSREILLLSLSSIGAFSNLPCHPGRWKGAKILLPSSYTFLN